MSLERLRNRWYMSSHAFWTSDKSDPKTTMPRYITATFICARVMCVRVCVPTYVLAIVCMFVRMLLQVMV